LSSISFGRKRPSVHTSNTHPYSRVKLQKVSLVNNTLNSNQPNNLQHFPPQVQPNNLQHLPPQVQPNNLQHLPPQRSENLVRFWEERTKESKAKLSETELKMLLLKYIKFLFKDSRRKWKKELRQLEEQTDDETELRLFKKVRYFLLQKTKSIL